MVQLKYFGDSRDYFKYDLITSILDKNNKTFENYIFVPMLTEHRTDDNEGKKTPNNTGRQSEELLSFIRKQDSKSLSHWEKWLRPYVNNYKTVEPVDETFFKDDTRKEYWITFKEYLKEKSALIFIDPDTGLESGTKSYLKKMGPAKYILNEEISLLHEYLDPSSVLMIYQHLPNDKRIHEESVSKKLKQLKANQNVFVCGYRENDLVFLFMSKNAELYNRLYNTIKIYHDNRKHKYKSIHSMQEEMNLTSNISFSK